MFNTGASTYLAPQRDGGRRRGSRRPSHPSSPQPRRRSSARYSEVGEVIRNDPFRPRVQPPVPMSSSGVSDDFWFHHQ